MNALIMPEEPELAELVVIHSCTRNCLGVKNNSSGCCTMGDRDYIIGPIPDAKAFLKRYKETEDANASYQDVFIDYKEGSELFPHLSTWQNEDNYPAIRVKTENPSNSCQFLGSDSLCSVHKIRSITCRNFTCGHVKDILEKLSL